MMKKILFYVAAFAVSLVFANNAYAEEKLEYEVIKPHNGLIQVSDVPVMFSQNDYSNGILDNNEYSYSPASMSNIFNNELLDLASYQQTTITFKDEMDIEGLYAAFYRNTSLEGELVFTFYDVDNNSLGSKSVKFVQTGTSAEEVKEYVDNLSFGAVKKVVVSMNTSKDSGRYIREIDFFGTNKSYKPVQDVNAVVTDTTASISWKLLNANAIDYVLVDGVSVNKSVAYLIKDLKPETEYTISIDTVYKDGTVINLKYTFKTDVPKDVTPPSEVDNFTVDPDKTSVSISWSIPSDKDYEATWLYRDGVLIKKFTNETTYTDQKLKEDTTYVYKLVTVDTSGNKSDGISKTVLTKHTVTTIPPDSPVLTAKPLSKGVKLSWNMPISGTVKGYKIYQLDGGVATARKNFFGDFVITAHAAGATQINNGLLASTSYQATGLNNGTAYSFYVVAVNSSGLSSAPSNTVTVTPTAQAVPASPVAGSYDLADVASSTTNWFGSVWLILAFAIGIFLAFIIANRVKRLFFA